MLKKISKDLKEDQTTTMHHQNASKKCPSNSLDIPRPIHRQAAPKAKKKSQAAQKSDGATKGKTSGDGPWAGLFKSFWWSAGECFFWS